MKVDDQNSWMFETTVDDNGGGIYALYNGELKKRYDCYDER